MQTRTNNYLVVLRTYEVQLDIMNGLMVAHLRAQVYRQRIAEGWIPDTDAAQWLYVNSRGSDFGSQAEVDKLRARIVHTLELKTFCRKEKYREKT